MENILKITLILLALLSTGITLAQDNPYFDEEKMQDSVRELQMEFAKGLRKMNEELEDLADELDQGGQGNSRSGSRKKMPDVGEELGLPLLEYGLNYAKAKNEAQKWDAAVDHYIDSTFGRFLPDFFTDKIKAKLYWTFREFQGSNPK